MQSCLKPLREEENPLRIGTHNGRFHADEVFAIAILKQIYPRAEVTRSRNPEALSQCDIVVDVGGGKYDHHTTDKLYRENGIPYASAGLIWRDFGEQVMEQWDSGEHSTALVRAIEEKLIEGIDAADNGCHLEKDMRINSVPEIIGGFNPSWNASDDENDAFHRAVGVATLILQNRIRSEVAKMAAVESVSIAFDKRPRKEIMVLGTFCPWTETLLSLDDNEEVLFVIFPDKSGGYRIQVVPKSPGSFEARKPLPEEWAGKEGEALGSVIGIPDAVFCHPARFIAGAVSQASVMKMAQIAVEI